MLEQITSPTIQKNLKKKELKPDVQLISGDWNFMKENVKGGEWDLILSAETLYNKQNHEIFLDLLKHLLSPTGEA